MSLANMIIESKTIQTEYPGYDDLVIKLAHLTRDELMNLRKKATTSKFSKKTRKPEEEVDSELFQDLYIKAVVVGWEGFKYKYLESMLPIDLSGLTNVQYCGGTEDNLGESGEGLFPYSKEDASTLMKNCSDFDNWITSELDDIENFTKNS